MNTYNTYVIYTNICNMYVYIIYMYAYINILKEDSMNVNPFNSDIPISIKIFNI